MSSFGQPPSPEPVPATAELTFQKAQPLQAPGRTCAACKQPIPGTYYHAQGQVVCPICAERIQTGQQAAPPISLLRGLLYGGGAALGGCILYATVSIVTGVQFGLMAIVVGVMVGKAIRYASQGLGGRPQQIMAVALTYFAITTSYIPLAIYHVAKKPKPVAATQTSAAGPVSPSVQERSASVAPPRPASRMSLSSALFYLLLVTAAAPFMSLGSGFSGLISLFIIFIGLQQAWKRTGRSEILIMGPYEPTPGP